MITVELQEIDTVKAADILIHNNWEGQRPIRDSQVAYLADEMNANRFIQGTQIHFCNLNGKLLLINGQHTLAAIVKSEKPQWLTVLTTPVAAEQEVVELYYRHDNFAGRNAADFYKAAGLSKSGITFAQFKIMMPAVKYLRFHGQGNIDSKKARFFRSKDNLLTDFYAWKDTAKDFFELIQPPVSFVPELKKSAWVAVSFLLLKEGLAKRLAFIENVVTGDDMKTGDPRKTFREWLMTTTLSSRFIGSKTVVSNAQIARACVLSYNAFWKTETLAEIPNKMLFKPINLEGTSETF